MSQATDDSKQYTVSVHTDDIHEAISQLSDALYTCVQDALATHSCREEEDCRFGAFARDLLGTLDRHADQLLGEDAPDCVSDEDEEKKWPYV